jgi:hypothetical protein
MDKSAHLHPLQCPTQIPASTLPSPNISCRSTIILNDQFLQSALVTRYRSLRCSTRYWFFVCWLDCRALIWPSKSVEVVDFRDWLEIVDMFVGSAKLVEKAGWDGVQIHSAHGYLLAEFLSPLVSLMVAMRGTSF